MLPSTLDKVTLVGVFQDGTTAEGETNITDSGKQLKHLSLRPSNCRATEEAVDAIKNAERSKAYEEFCKLRDKYRFEV